MMKRFWFSTVLLTIALQTLWAWDGSGTYTDPYLVNSTADWQQLAAHALGLGAVWTAVYPMEDRIAPVCEALKLPETVIPLCTIVIGHPAEQPEPKDKWKPENVSYNEFGGNDSK